MLARLGEGSHVHAIMHVDPQRNIVSNDSIEDLAFEQESWKVSNIVPRKNSSTIKTQASIRDSFAALKVGAMKRLWPQANPASWCCQNRIKVLLKLHSHALGPLPPILAL